MWLTPYIFSLLQEKAQSPFLGHQPKLQRSRTPLSVSPPAHHRPRAALIPTGTKQPTDRRGADCAPLSALTAGVQDGCHSAIRTVVLSCGIIPRGTPERWQMSFSLSCTREPCMHTLENQPNSQTQGCSQRGGQRRQGHTVPAWNHSASHHHDFFPFWCYFPATIYITFFLCIDSHFLP